MNMDRVLRSRTIASRLIEDDDRVQLSDDYESDNVVDHLSEMSEDSEYSPTDSNDDLELENATFNQRLLQVRENTRGPPVSVLRGKNGYTWSVYRPGRHSDRVENNNVTIPRSRPAGPASNMTSIEEFWDCLFTNEMLELIVKYTNLKIGDVVESMMIEDMSKQSYHYVTDLQEIKAFIGILYYAGLWKANNIDLEELWSKRNGTTFYRTVMSLQRFRFLSKCLRFDEKESRDASDKFAAVRVLWETFIENCKKNYSPYTDCTVDEQLLSFRGKCPFRMYIPSKPDKYGLKIVTLNDAQTSYLINGIPYLGKSSVERTQSLPETVFTKVTEPIYGSGRTVTCDNWFTSIPLVEKMMENPYNLKITGTIRKNKLEIPAEMIVASKKPPESKFCYSKTKPITMVSFSPKKNKIVILVSSLLSTNTITNGKPEIILHYNKTKGGTDCFDQLCHAYTVSRRTNRWPVRIFFGILDQAIVNARILYKCKMVNSGDESAITAKYCLRKLALYLTLPLLRERFCNPHLRVELRLAIRNIVEEQKQIEPTERQYLEKQARCLLCKRKKDRKSRLPCQLCGRPMCDEHRCAICIECNSTD